MDNNPVLDTPVRLTFSTTAQTQNYPKFDLTLTHKVTFIEGPSSSGKSYFFDVLLQLQGARLLDLSEWILQPLLIREQLDRFMIPVGKTILLVDIDNLDCGIDEILDIFNVPSDVLIICAGHHFISRVYVPLSSIYVTKYSKRKNVFDFSLEYFITNKSLERNLLNLKSFLFNKE